MAPSFSDDAICVCMNILLPASTGIVREVFFDAMIMPKLAAKFIRVSTKTVTGSHKTELNGLPVLVITQT